MIDQKARATILKAAEAMEQAIADLRERDQLLLRVHDYLLSLGPRGKKRMKLAADIRELLNRKGE